MGCCASIQVIVESGHRRECVCVCVFYRGEQQQAMETSVQQHPCQNTKQHMACHRKSNQKHGNVVGLMLCHIVDKDHTSWDCLSAPYCKAPV